MKAFVALFILLLLNQALAYTYQRTSNGSNVRWPDASSTLVFSIDSSNSSNISSSNFNSIISDTFARWNSLGGPLMSANFNQSGAQENRNDILFSSDPFVFGGSSVLAVTKNTFNNDTGRILESDIYIKDTVTFSTNQASKQYIGNILLHELGHSLGLDHSEELFSTMFYQQIRGQHTLKDDDEWGKRHLYDISGGGGSLRGTVAGSQSVIPVFGASVRLISALKGKVIASTLSDEDGSFYFKSLPLDDVYYIYISPVALPATLSKHYQSIRSDFCAGFAQFSGSFYETCDSGRVGKPQGIYLSSSTPQINTGVISIKCGINIPTGYLAARSSAVTYNLIENSNFMGESMVGFFTEDDIINNRFDEISVDLSSYNFTENDLYLDVKIVSHDLYSKVAYDALVTSPSITASISPTVDIDGNPNLNLEQSYLIDSITSANNNFTIRVTPKSISDYLSTSSFSLEDDVIPASSSVASEKYFYQLIVNVIKKNGLVKQYYSHYPYGPPRGNNSCMDGPKTYGVKSGTTVASAQTTSRRKSSARADELGALACGTVALIDDSNNGSGPKGLAVISLGFLLGLALSRRFAL